jgi:hypothetical protein
MSLQHWFDRCKDKMKMRRPLILVVWLAARQSFHTRVTARDLRIPGMAGRTVVYGRARSHGFEQGKRVEAEWVSVESDAHINGLSISLSAEYVDESAANAAEALLAHLRLRVVTSANALLRITRLREAKRVLHGIDGEEVLIRAREFNFTKSYGFTWETPGRNGGPLQPYPSLELQTGISEMPGGKPVETSLHEDAVLSLWDTIASSIRLRKADPASLRAERPNGPAQRAKQLAAH